MRKLNMYIPIRDETNHMIKIYQYLYNKYWGDMNVYFLGYSKPTFELEKNIHFISLAEKRDPKPTAWSNDLIKFFKQLPDQYFYFSLEDLLVIRPVDFELLDICEEMMNPSIGRIDLWNSVQYDIGRRGWLQPYKTHRGVTFVKEHSNAPPSVYKISCSNSIWNRAWFLKTLFPNWSTYDWETKGNDGRNNDGFEVISPVNRWTPSVVHALSGKNWGAAINVDGMFPDDKQKVAQLLKDINVDKQLIEFTSMNQVINLRGFQPTDSDVSNF